MVVTALLIYVSNAVCQRKSRAKFTFYAYLFIMYGRHAKKLHSQGRRNRRNLVLQWLICRPKGRNTLLSSIDEKMKRSTCLHYHFLMIVLK